MVLIDLARGPLMTRAVGALPTRPIPLRLVGEHDASTVETVRGRLARAIAVGDADVAVDLSAVTFMSAAIATELGAARSLLAREGRALVLTDPSRVARRMLDLCAVASGPAIVGSSRMRAAR